jgi:uncharacterized membrane protein YcaP (DUF421 family)
MLDAVAYRWPVLRPIVKSRPTPLIVDGQINDRALRHEFMYRDELMSQLRLQGITHPREVALAHLKPNGMISIIRMDHAEPDKPPKPPVSG